MRAATPMPIAAPPEPQRYPHARATHAEVYDDPTLFHETLRELYEALDIRVAKVMKLGGQELNLHLLYQRVRVSALWHVPGLKRHPCPFGRSMGKLLWEIDTCVETVPQFGRVSSISTAPRSGGCPCARSPQLLCMHP